MTETHDWLQEALAGLEHRPVPTPSWLLDALVESVSSRKTAASALYMKARGALTPQSVVRGLAFGAGLAGALIVGRRLTKRGQTDAAVTSA